MKDKSNFYNLTGVEQDNERKDLWKDSFPDVPKFANDLKKAILQQECPRVIALEGGYGMGKTYFSSRFCEYLGSNRKEPISAIYFSAWEDDNLPDPFLSFSKEISQNLQTTKENIRDILKIFIKVMSSFDISFGMPGLSTTFKFKDLKEELLKQENPLRNFKSDLTKIITELPGKHLVLIVDELDRCRPDYAIRVLEVIKHFFDVDGITIILPVNYNTLTSCIESVYSLDNFRAGEYLRKFINYRVNIPAPNYEQFIDNQINESTFAKEIKKGYLDVESKPFCSLQTLQQDLIKYSVATNPSLRELTNLLSIVEFAIHHKEERIRSSLLVHLLFKKFIKDNRDKQTFSGNLPISPELNELLDKKIQLIYSQYKEYVDKAVTIFNNHRRGYYPQGTKEDEVFGNLEKKFNHITTYGELLTYLNELSGPLYNLYSGINLNQESFSIISRKLAQLIDQGINAYGIFEVTDTLLSKPQIEIYNALVNQLQI
ncbi:MAG: hypothetical protein J6Y85_04640 [Alphaproteobacteria bacterium]|nr:hypothetical protein [Alphaproteobacteria bacterium]